MTESHDDDKRDWISSEDLDAILEEMKAKSEARVAAELESLRREGIEPASTDGICIFGCPVFHVSLRWTDETSDDVEVKIGYIPETGGRSRLVWGKPWPRHGAVVSGTSFLRALAANWRILGRGYLASGVPDTLPEDESTVVDLGKEIGRDDLPVFQLVCGKGGTVLRSGTEDTDLESEILIVVETFKAVGNFLSSRMEASGRNAEASEWLQVRDLVDVFPMPPEGVSAEQWNAHASAEAEFYAAKIGMDLELYRRVAVWLRSRQYLHCSRSDVKEPTADEWDLYVVPETMPGHEEVMSLAAEAARWSEDDLDDFVVGAVYERNLHVRSMIFFR